MALTKDVNDNKVLCRYFGFELLSPTCCKGTHL